MRSWICTTLTSLLGPVQGAARLYAFAKKQGHDIGLKDLNQDCFFALLSRPYLEETFERSAFILETVKRNRPLRENIGSILLNSSAQAFRKAVVTGFVPSGWRNALLESPAALRNPVVALLGTKIRTDNAFYAMLAQKEYVLAQIEKSRQVLDREFLGLPIEDFIRNYRTLLCGKALIDAAFFPAQLDFGFGFHGTAYFPRAPDIVRAVNDERHNYLIPYYVREIVPLLRKEQPEVVGISITHVSELIPAFTLAHVVKSEYPSIHVCLGGATVTEIGHRLCGNQSLWQYFDSLSVGPGEYTFTRLLEQVGKRGSISGIPNLMYKEGGTVRTNGRFEEFDLNDACTPEYVSVRKRSSLPLETASGCYWGRCIFCYYPKEGTANLNPEFSKKRMRNIELVLKDMDALADKYLPSYIGITDSSLHPKRMEQIVEHNTHTDKAVRFSAFFRFEKEFLSQAFCRKLAEGGFLGGQVGLESGSQRVNDIINKGIEISDAGKILKNLRDSRILVHLYSIVGLPTESRDESELTYRFIRRHRKMLQLGWQVYSMGITEHGPLAARLNEFGIKGTPLPPDYLVQAMQYTAGRGLSQSESTGLAVSYTERLKRHLHPLVKTMDIESSKIVLQAFRARPNS